MLFASSLFKALTAFTSYSTVRTPVLTFLPNALYIAAQLHFPFSADVSSPFLNSTTFPLVPSDCSVSVGLSVVKLSAQFAFVSQSFGL